MLAQVDNAGPAAVLSSVAGVVVSLTAVWLNSREQRRSTKNVEDESVSRALELEAEVDRLRGEVALLTKRLVSAEDAKVDRDRLMELVQAYGGRRIRRRLLDIDLRRS